MTREYDAIIVGARCAGAPTAMLLARKCYRVLLVDRASFPSDTLSTNVIHAPGISALRRWGLLDALVASGCPPIRNYSFELGPFTISGTPRPHQGSSTGYAPRRTVLDKILVDAAARAGAELREHFNVDEIVIEDGAVVGIRGHGEGGEPVFERARVVIGADGRNSRVAKAVGAGLYHEKPRLQWSYYAYWSGLPVDGLEIVVRPDRGWAAAPTNDGLTMLGDAGHTKDPVTAQGISDAFRDAELCATALDECFTGRRTYAGAMDAYQQTRDSHALPIYEYTTQLATLAPPPAEIQQLLAAVHGNQEAMDSFVSVTAGTVSPIEFFDPQHIDSLMRAA